MNGANPEFAATRWSLIGRAGTGDSNARHALRELCEIYWQPAYCFLRRMGRDPDQAMDIVQGFVAELLEHGGIGGADPSRGRFRNFLLGALKHYEANLHRHAGAARRGGGQKVLSLDAEDADRAYQPIANESMTPDRVFLRRWAESVLERAIHRTERHCKTAGQEALFAAVRPLLTGDKPTQRYAALSERLGISEGALKVAVHRLRQQFRNNLRAEIAETVESPGEIDGEVRALAEALR